MITMIVETIERLRRLPKSARDRYAFFFAAGFTAVVALAWITFLPGRFAASDKTLAEGGTHTPFSSLVKGLKNQVAQLGAVITGGPESVTSSSTPTRLTATTTTITLSPDELDKAAAALAEYEAASSNAAYLTTSTTTVSGGPASRVVLIATTSSPLSGSTTPAVSVSP